MRNVRPASPESHVRLRELALREQQRELVDLLARGEQVAFAALREERERVARNALLVSRQPFGEPRRQRSALDRHDGDRDARVGE